MSGSKNGLQTLVKFRNRVLFDYCFAHMLNLVSDISVECIKECKNFFKYQDFLHFQKSSNTPNPLIVMSRNIFRECLTP